MTDQEYHHNARVFNTRKVWKAANTNRWPWKKRFKAYLIWVLIAITLISFLVAGF